jgi:hypothetical protein
MYSIILVRNLVAIIICISGICSTERKMMLILQCVEKSAKYSFVILRLYGNVVANVSVKINYIFSSSVSNLSKSEIKIYFLFNTVGN